jgi:hypothetical protein
LFPVLYIKTNSNLDFKEKYMNKKYLDDLGLAEVASIVNQKLKQVSEMPLASEELAGKIYQYVGNTTSLYTNGYFYGCDEVGGSYQWVRKNVQDDTPHVTGTYNEIQQMIANDEIPDGAYAGITDDYDDSVGVVDKIEDNNMKAVTSNAVYDALAPIGAHASGYFYGGFNATGQHNTTLTLGEGTWLVVMTLLVGSYLSGDMYMTVGGVRASGFIRVTDDGKDDTSTLVCSVTVAAGTTKVIGLNQTSGAANVNGDANYWYVDAYRLK